MTAVAFDIETTGLSADDEVTSVAVFGDKVESVYSQTDILKERVLLENLSNIVYGCGKDTMLITFNGQNFRGGFDFPLLRTRFHKHGIAWPFIGMMHLDIYPIIEKLWNTAQPYWQTLDQLLVDDLKKMVQFFGIDGKPKVKQNYIDLISGNVNDVEVNKYIREHFDSKIRDINSLKGAYQIITGKDPGEIDGAGAVQLWQQYIETGDTAIIEQIRQYNLDDCKKTLELYEICQQYCSQRDMQPVVL